MNAMLNTMHMLANVLALNTAGCANASFDATKCSTSFATPVIDAAQVIGPLLVIFGIIAHGVEGKSSAKAIAVEALVGAILIEIVVQIIKAIAGA
jgi:hypothetical protein